MGVCILKPTVAFAPHYLRRLEPHLVCVPFATSGFPCLLGGRKPSTRSLLLLFSLPFQTARAYQPTLRVLPGGRRHTCYGLFVLISFVDPCHRRLTAEIAPIAGAGRNNMLQLEMGEAGIEGAR